MQYITEITPRAVFACFSGLRGKKVLIKLVPAEKIRPSELVLVSQREKANQASGVRGQSSVLAIHDLPDDEVAALSFSKERL